MVYFKIVKREHLVVGRVPWILGIGKRIWSIGKRITGHGSRGWHIPIFLHTFSLETKK